MEIFETDLNACNNFETTNALTLMVMTYSSKIIIWAIIKIDREI